MFQKEFLNKYKNYRKSITKKRIQMIIKNRRYKVMKPIHEVNWLYTTHELSHNILKTKLTAIFVINKQQTQVKSIIMGNLNTQNPRIIKHVFKQFLIQYKVNFCITRTNTSSLLCKHYLNKNYYRISKKQKTSKCKIRNHRHFYKIKHKGIKLKINEQSNYNSLQQLLLCLWFAYRENMFKMFRFHTENINILKIQTHTGTTVNFMKNSKKRHFFSNKSVFLHNIS